MKKARIIKKLDESTIPGLAKHHYVIGDMERLANGVTYIDKDNLRLAQHHVGIAMRVLKDLSAKLKKDMEPEIPMEGEQP